MTVINKDITANRMESFLLDHLTCNSPKAEKNTTHTINWKEYFQFIDTKDDNL